MNRAPGQLTSTDWRPPTELPDLRRVGIIALDTETKDDGLLAERGSGWATRQGHICGISVAYRIEANIQTLYIPLRHPDTQNFAPEQVHAWLRDHVASDLRFVTQNGLYDWGWLRVDGDVRIPPGERIEEIGALATMIDENCYQYGLDALCKWRGLPGKDESLLHEGCTALDLDHQEPQEVQTAELHSPIAGTLCWPLCRSRRLQHLSSI